MRRAGLIAGALAGLLAAVPAAAETAADAAEAAARAFDMPGAMAQWQAARAAATPGSADWIAATRGLALAAMVYDPPRAAAALDDLLGDKAMRAALPEMQRAELLGLRGRAAFNMGEAQTANRWLDAAIKASGGLYTREVTLTQVSIRGDAAIAVQLLGSDKSVMRYLMRAGVRRARWEKTFAAVMEPPLCDGETVRPDDMAIVEFSVAPDGAVTEAATVYASRPGAMGIAFARAVAGWHWRTGDVAGIDSFWRSRARVELRCASRPAPAHVGRQFYRETRQWLRAQGLDDAKLEALWSGGTPALALAAGQPVPTLAVLLGMIDDGAIDAAGIAETEKLLAASAAPPAVRAWALVYADAPSAGVRARAAARVARFTAALPGFATTAPNSLALAWLRLETGLAYETLGENALAARQLTTLLATPEAVLPHDALIRNVATVHLATLDQLGGQPDAARARLTAAGLDPAQCALFDLRPALTQAETRSYDYPAASLQREVNGYVRLDYDIDAKGKPVDIRVIIAYPPFLFGEAARATISRFRFVPPVLDGTDTGCNGQVHGMNYIVAE